MAKFHHYSFGNVLLIAMQKRDATRVAGIYSWNQLKRRVRRGEKGIMIFAPMIGRKRRKNAEGEGNQGDSVYAKSISDARTSDVQLIGFRPVYVWDVSRPKAQNFPWTR